jgi:hypothetical protein
LYHQQSARSCDVIFHQDFAASIHTNLFQGLLYLNSHDGENWLPKEENTINYIELKMVQNMQHNDYLLSKFKVNCAAKYESSTDVLMFLKQLLLLSVFKPFKSFSASIVFTPEMND